jgi:hypothetical protein
MSTHVLLHLNLLSTPDAARTTLYELLEAKQWFKVHPSFTAWRCKYKDDVENVPAEVVREIKQLALKAGVPKLYGVAQCGNSVAFDFEYDATPKLYLKRT